MSRSRIWFFSAIVVFFPKLLIWSFIGRTSILAPDEEIYLRTFSRLYQTSFELDSSTGFSSRSEFSMRMILSPAFLLAKGNVENVWSLRIYSALLFFATVLLILRYINSYRIQFFFLGLLLIFPTIHAWTSLGIRESLIYFSLTLIFSTFYRIYQGKGSFLHFFLHLLGYFILLNIKTYLAIIAFTTLVVTICLYTLFFKNFQELKSRNLITMFGLILSTLLLGAFFPFEIQAQRNLIFVTNVPNTIQEDRTTGPDEVEEVTNTLQPKMQLERLKPATIEEPSSFFPAILNFLLRPLPLLDTGRPEVNVVAVESIVWFGLFVLTFLLIVIAVLQRGMSSIGAHFPALIFTVLFILASALLETNIGTASRHRSLLFFVVIPICLNYSRLLLRRNPYEY